jgi:Leucine-rich repeat (LRR) protein
MIICKNFKEKEKMEYQHNFIIFQEVDLEELTRLFESSKSLSDPFYELSHSEAFLKFKLVRDFGVDAKSLVNLSIQGLVLLTKEKIWERKLLLTQKWLEKYGVKKSVEELANLTHLDLRGNKISDVSPLKGLANLTVLNLHYNKITVLTHLKGLANLTTLYLSNNEISDVSPLKGLANLTVLNLHYNKITMLTHLEGLANLTELYLSNNEITDVSPLKGLANLTTLALSNNDISDASPLKGLANLTVLNLKYNKISGKDIEELKKMVKNFYF